MERVLYNSVLIKKFCHKDLEDEIRVVFIFQNKETYGIGWCRATSVQNIWLDN